MSEFWKKRRPRMTDEEERALWERVRTMPSEAAGASRRRSPWASLWARPSVRFGAPVLAVALVAVVWVAQRDPEAPRPESAVGTLPTAPTAERPMATPPAAEDAPAVGNSAPALEAERAPATVPVEPQARRDRSDARVGSGELQSQEARPGRERAEDARDEAIAVKEESQTFAAPPAAAPAPAPTKVTVIKGEAEGKRAMAKSSAPETSAALGAADVTAQRMVAPLPPGDQATRVALLRSGSYFDRLCEDVVRPDGAGDLDVDVSNGGMRLRRSGGHWRIVGNVLSDPPRGSLQWRAAMVVRLDTAVRERDFAAARRVHEEALVNQRERPDEGGRALVDWAAAAMTVLEAE